MRYRLPEIPLRTRFTRLVVDEAGHRLRDEIAYRCRCDCGNAVVATASSLVRGHRRSCECLQRDVSAARHMTHDATGTSTFHIWKSMLDRCSRPADPRSRRYAARGIRVCERWQGPDGFSAFLADMGERPPGLSIDRIDNNGNYEPSNCRWATATEQVRNSSAAKLTADDVAVIRRRLLDGDLSRVIAGDYGVCTRNIEYISRGRTWKDIEPAPVVSL